MNTTLIIKQIKFNLEDLEDQVHGLNNEELSLVSLMGYVTTVACKQTRHLGILRYKMAIFYEGF